MIVRVVFLVTEHFYTAKPAVKKVIECRYLSKAWSGFCPDRCRAGVPGRLPLVARLLSSILQNGHGV